MKNKLTIVFITLLTISCVENKGLSEKEDVVIRNSIEYVLQNLDDDVSNCYIVQARFDSFTLDSYSKKIKADFLIKSGYSEEEYNKFLLNVNDEFEDVPNKDLAKFSKCEKSYNILTFTGVSKNLIIVKVISNSKELLLNELNSNKFSPSQVNIFVLFLNNQGDIVDDLQEVIIYN